MCREGHVIYSRKYGLVYMCCMIPTVATHRAIVVVQLLELVIEFGKQKCNLNYHASVTDVGCICCYAYLTIQK